MTHDPAIAIAETEAFGILLTNHLQYVEDARTCSIIASKLGLFQSLANKARVNIERGENWQLYCARCPYELAKNTHGRMECPTCGERLKYWNLDRSAVIVRR